MAGPHGLDDDEQEGGGPWPAFADLLAATTLLFLILFAAVAVPALRGAGAEQARRNTLDIIESRIQPAEESDSTVVVDRIGDYLRVRIGGDATFPQNRYELAQLRAEGKEILHRIGQLLQQGEILDSIDQIQVVGHTSVEGSDELNWMLSASRAATVSLFLIDSVGIPSCRVSALGRSRYYPIDPGSAAEGGVNPDDRRIELEIRPIVPSDSVQQRRRASCVE